MCLRDHNPTKELKNKATNGSSTQQEKPTSASGLQLATKLDTAINQLTLYIKTGGYSVEFIPKK